MPHPFFHAFTTPTSLLFLQLWEMLEDVVMDVIHQQHNRWGPVCRLKPVWWEVRPCAPVDVAWAMAPTCGLPPVLSEIMHTSVEPYLT